MNLSVTNTEADVTGLTRRCYRRRLQGTGYAVGARFRPGGFRPLSDGPVSALTDRHRPIAEVLGRDTSRLARDVAERSDPTDRAALLAAFLASGRPDPDPATEQAGGLVGSISADRGLTRVAPGRRAGGTDGPHAATAVRRVRRAGPKWVIQRCRLQDVAARVAAENGLDWAELAAELGFADQVNLTRAFTATIGVPPATCARQARTG